MKYLSIALALTFSLTGFAQKTMEYDEALEKTCYEEARKVGCVKGDAPTDTKCAKSKKTKLSQKCHQILGIL